ncbi:glycoside hydrolase family 18 protein [Pandoraea bronchicola]|uniref:chitinase n=1 Tax=Pandoraea bronchicola TaxID=2508287 RepID=A0A5E5BSL1_9BURK|nr:glycosyl hydrolase family 18 protein [Pandoraea bronchicola]VVE88065.1 chitinase [Pandoraea bronchicola]
MSQTPSQHPSTAASASRAAAVTPATSGSTASTRSATPGAQSELVYPSDPQDGATETTYAQNGFDPATSTTQLSYTSARVARRVYNRYAKNAFEVSGYYTDWSQYDGRLDGDFSNDAAGRGVDLMWLDPFAYDRLIIGFAGIVGDQGEKAQTVARAATDFVREPDQATFVDSWGDVLSYRNCGFDGWVSNDVIPMFQQSRAQGVLGGLRLLHAKNPALKLALAIGGWTMSEAFHGMAASAARRKTFCASVVDLFRRFPMFVEVNIDWEYPGSPGDTGNTYDDTDGANYAALVGDLKKALVAAGRKDVEISIAASANVADMTKANLPGLIAAGVSRLNLMTYDFFGTPWAPTLAHHTNLHDTDPGAASGFSVDRAVNWLRQAGVPLAKVHIGYAAYSRNALQADISQVSALSGTYMPGDGITTGTFESGTTEYYDVLFNYLDLENGTARNGFVLYTDPVADADFLYQPSSGMFMSLDTPRTVRAKGDYVRRNGLGGLFTWTIDQDNGVLANAAHEGLGQTATVSNFDMTPLYFSGKTSLDDTTPGGES